MQATKKNKWYKNEDKKHKPDTDGHHKSSTFGEKNGYRQKYSKMRHRKCSNALLINKTWVWFFSAWKSLKVWKPVRMFMLHFCCSFPPTRAYKLFLKQTVFYNLPRLNQNYIILSRMSRQWHVFCMCFNIPKDFLEGIYLAVKFSRAARTSSESIRTA